MEVKIIPTARALIMNSKNELLLVKNEVENPWFAPGGWLDGFETLEQTCAREVKEETGLTVKVLSFYKIDYYRLTAEQNIKWEENVNKIEVYFKCEIVSGEIKSDAENKNLWEDEDAGHTGFIKFFSKAELEQEKFKPDWLIELF